jgi:5-formyltetrahydrofolate cyclo-ligase
MYGAYIDRVGEGATVDSRIAKQALRSRIWAARRSRSPEQLAAIGARIRSVVLELPQVRVARCVALYASVPGEPDTGPLRAALRERGVRVLLPVVLPDLDLDWAQDDGTGQPSGGIGGDEPTGPRIGVQGIGQADVVVAPGLAIDTRGNRLGQGGGCYDRALRRVAPDAFVFALVFDNEVLDAGTDPIPVQPHDVRVPMVVTEHRWITLRRA